MKRRVILLFVVCLLSLIGLSSCETDDTFVTENQEIFGKIEPTDVQPDGDSGNGSDTGEDEDGGI